MGAVPWAGAELDTSAGIASIVVVDRVAERGAGVVEEVGCARQLPLSFAGFVFAVGQQPLLQSQALAN